MTRAWPYMPGVPAAGHIVAAGGYWHSGAIDTCSKCNPRGANMEQTIVSRSQMEQCPRRSLLASHYNEDGTCKCCMASSWPFRATESFCLREAPHMEAHRDRNGFEWGADL